MNKINPIDDFLSNFPLFTPFMAVEEYQSQNQSYTDPFELQGTSFRFFCETEKTDATFELEISEATKEHFGKLPGDRIPSELIDELGKLDYIHHFKGKCRSCKSYQVDFLLHIYSDNPIPVRHSNIVNKSSSDRANIYIEKLGGPPLKIKVDKAIEKYLDRESGSWYYKAKKSLVDKLGIGAFAYLRRIIEKELNSIVEDVSKLEGADPKLKEIVSKHVNSKNAHRVYDDIYDYLPRSLQVLEENPFKILYKQTSQGLHNLSENDCLERAQQLIIIFEFVIKKISEERSELLTIKEAIKSLKRIT
ncbi:hypothetical protein [Pedobacter sp. W3I1]|uniref:hypothetical protein n=1 Tax=Pedobacter sp. W3I1 TaxID=3042291 RepID=UPI0027D81829|nr:hypothetical protein [Pedobacter sp. W3I1]